MPPKKKIKTEAIVVNLCSSCSESSDSEVDSKLVDTENRNHKLPLEVVVSLGKTFN